MYTSIAVVSLLTAVAVAQNASTNPLMPTGTTGTCSSYVAAFNTGTSLSGCIKAIADATKGFAPGTNPTNADVDPTLKQLCSAQVDAACPDTAVRAELTKFWSACQTDISNKNQGVLTLYDTLFAFIPFRKAACSTDDSGAYCAAQVAKNTNSAPANLKGSLSYTPGLKRETAVAPNVTTIGQNNIPFLFLNPSTPSNVLCTSCTRKVFAAYSDFETNMPYGPGLQNSPTLSGQVPLYDAINSNCGPNFLSGAVQAAGSLSGGIGSDTSAALTTVADFKTVAVVALGIISALASFN